MLNMGMVLGFVFCYGSEEMLLIKKTHPDWQRGKLNAIGGRIEPGEIPVETMVREFLEEAGVTTTSADWNWFALINTSTVDELNLYVFSTVLEYARFGAVKSVTDEAVVLIDDSHIIPGNVIPNLHWLVPMARRAADANTLVRIEYPTLEDSKRY
jgi:8-oxo-dGTP diphosphatase